MVSHKIDINIEKESLDKNGYISPVRLNDTNKIKELSEQLEFIKKNPMNRHLDNKLISDIFGDTTLNDVVSRVFGQQLRLWRTNFFFKDNKSHTKEIGWHHDKHFQSGDNDIDFNELSSHFSILIAVNDMTKENGCIEVIPGTHVNDPELERDSRPFHFKDISEHFINIPEHISKKSVPIRLNQGEFLLFHSALLHRSLQYSSGNPRASMIGRLMSEDVVLPKHLLDSKYIDFN